MKTNLLLDLIENVFSAVRIGDILGYFDGLSTVPCRKTQIFYIFLFDLATFQKYKNFLKVIEKS